MASPDPPATATHLDADEKLCHTGDDTGDADDSLQDLETQQIKATSTSGGDLARVHSHKSQVVEVGYLHPVTDLANNVVGWDGQDDPENPRNFPLRKKVFIMGLVSSITFISPLASSMFAPAVPFMSADFNVTSTVLNSFVVSVFVLGWAFGPLLLSPLSEIYGRRRVMDAGNFFFAVWQIGCALAPNVGSLIAFRFFAGLGGSGCLTIGGGIISDLFAPDQRGIATSLYSLGPLIGPVIGPIAGGFLGENTSWRWIFWVLLIASALLSMFIFFVNEETNPHILIANKVERLKKETGNEDLISWYLRDSKPRTKGQILRSGLLRPLKMLTQSPIVIMLASYMAFVYGILYLLFTTITLVFTEVYGWKPQMTGLAFLGIGLGFFTGIVATAKLSDATVVRLAARNKGVAEPEMRLPTCAFFALFMPISLFWYGWCADKHTHWIVVIIALLPYGFGMMGIFIPIQTYMIDAFSEHAASALAALTALRSVMGAFLPMAGPSMYNKLGLGWGNSLLGFISIGLAAPIYLIYRYGKAIRQKYPVDLS